MVIYLPLKYANKGEKKCQIKMDLCAIQDFHRSSGRGKERACI